MLNIDIIRVTNQAGLNAIQYESNADVLLYLDNPLTVDTATVPMPPSPAHCQMFLLSSRSPITSLTLSASGKTIIGTVNTLVSSGVIGWVFDAFTNTWFQYSNTVVGSKGQVGLGNVDNTSDLLKPISTATQASLDTKLGAGTIANAVYSRITGSDATTTGQVLTAITNGSTPLQNALVANAVYEVECVLAVGTSAVTTGTGYGINFSAGGATFNGFIQGATSTTASRILRLNAFNTASSGWLTSSGQTGGILIKGVITTGVNAGNVFPQHVKTTSGTSTVFQQSYLKTIRIV